jgi:hypothetical protein
MTLSNARDVQHLLNTVKSLIDEGRFDLVLRRETRLTITQLGLVSQWDVADIITGLTLQDYSAGPKPDMDTSKRGSVWEFGATVDGNLIYLKLKVRESNPQEVVCLSFHPPERPMKFPYRK